MTQLDSDHLILSFGERSIWKVPNTSTVASFFPKRHHGAPNLESTVHEALTRPIDFPSMDQSVVPGDRLVFAVDPSLPSLPELMSAVVGFFHSQGTPEENMCIVLAGNVPGQASRISKTIQHQRGFDIAIEIHDPANPELTSYVAADAQAEPIYVNRTVVDADVVLPVVCGRTTGSLDYFGPFGLFPMLSNRATQERFFDLSNLLDSERHPILKSAADEAARWTGFIAAIFVIPDGNDQIRAVIAGLSAEADRACREEMDSAWAVPNAVAALTIALVDGTDVQRDGLALARVLRAADRCTRESGSIVVCTEAEQSFGDALARAFRDEPNGNGPAAVELSLTARLIEQVASDKHIYVASHIEREMLESLGMSAIGTAGELSKLMSQSESTIILSSAQYR